MERDERRLLAQAGGGGSDAVVEVDDHLAVQAVGGEDDATHLTRDTSRQLGRLGVGHAPVVDAGHHGVARRIGFIGRGPQLQVAYAAAELAQAQPPHCDHIVVALEVSIVDFEHDDGGPRHVGEFEHRAVIHRVGRVVLHLGLRGARKIPAALHLDHDVR